MRNLIKRIAVSDPFVSLLMAVVVAASFLPCRGSFALFLDYATDAGIVLLFFLHGAKLSRESIVSGMLNYRLHIATLAVTFFLFPVLGLLLIRAPGIDPSLKTGILYLTLLPSTVQSSIAFTSIAKGDVPAAVCAATLSNLLGMFVTPVLVGIFMQIPGGQTQVTLDSVRTIALQLLLPFLVGHLARPMFAVWLAKHKSLIGRVDRGTILLVVYTAFSASVVAGLWTRISALNILVMILISCGLLAFVLGVCWRMGLWLGLKREDVIVLLFCGSKKSLASGVPIAGTLFPPTEIGLIILPLMIFHQIQLIVCAVIAKRMSKCRD
ncbi:MAG: bile acid:sodium symporter [Planctomycetota bacterium]|nr:bile acid:sodium symporter [Planctomycetota bacterium]